MGAYDSSSNPNPTRRNFSYDPSPRPPWSPGPDGADRAGGLADRFSAMAVSDPEQADGSIFQVMKAVEDAENTIKQQLEENNQLRDQLLWQARELEKYKSESTSIRSSSEATREAHTKIPYKANVSNVPAGVEKGRTSWMDHNSSINPQGTLVIHANGMAEMDNPSLQNSRVDQQYSESIKVNGSSKVPPGSQTGVDGAGASQHSTPSSRSLSPSRHRKETEYDPRYNPSGHGLMPISETHSNILWKQDLIVKVRDHEEEIAMLRKHLADYSIKEAQIRNEKFVLEKRIAYMRMAFDQQQLDLVDAASKALSYRQDIIEENIRLTYALQAAQQERSIFASSLLPLLSDYGLQPSVLDAQSIVSNLRVLFKHLQEKLILIEDKLKESQYQIAPWRAEPSNYTSGPPESPSHSLGAAVANSNKSLEIVPQPPYSHAQSPISSPPNAQTKLDWESVGNQNRHVGPSGFSANIPDHDNVEKAATSMSRNTTSYDTTTRVNAGNSHVRFSAESKDQNPSFKDLVRSSDTDDSEAAGLQHGRETNAQWGPGSSPFLASGLDDPNSSYPYLPPVLEEPTSSFSEAAEDDPLPAIEGLQISGEAFPGRDLQACGYMINGTTSCNFEWVRCLEDGSVNYIEGAKQPIYLVTADDVDSYLAIEVHPLDERKRKGNLVKVFANDQRKITCDSEMQEQIERTLSIGHTSYEVSLSADYIDIWEQSILAIKREGYSIKCSGPRGVVVSEKFLPTTAITIPYGHPTAFSIQSTSGIEYLLRTKDGSSFRDTIVLTMRLFKKMALEKRKGRKKGFFKT
ncbi:uncharacterized protein M6B38_287050 [Iris pallida]|uniref:DUF7046 domain-containing protein n=1 Tax=Iris pallida TaxID=29817 RepID=A0AAX6HWK2_IRIPA|nr:uncharacterized protein M6B38_205340 [Iris pallida]KAJ6845459.1 uncharacterized protein M6B38_287050 [Iris pallida]